jgi:hypothetical protein
MGFMGPQSGHYFDVRAFEEAEMANRPIVAILALVGALSVLSPALAQEGQAGQPFQLGIKQNVQGEPGYAEYPTPKMIQQEPRVEKQPPKAKPKAKPIQLNAQQNQERTPPPQQPVRQPIQASAQASPPPGVLPSQFMGNWLVLGARQNIQARPEYQNGIENIFTSNNSQTWNIVGQPGSYSMSSTSGVQSVQVGQCNQGTAFLRYQHPVGNTVAQEAIVMQLSPDGQSFQGMQRITIKKQGEPTPRAQVTYQLMGRRQ